MKYQIESKQPWQASDWLAGWSLEEHCREMGVDYQVLLSDIAAIPVLVDRLEKLAERDGIIVEGIERTVVWMRDRALEDMEDSAR